MAGLFAVGAGGFIGACFRFIISKWTNGIFVQFPVGTLLSNIIAGFFIGYIIGFEQHSIRIPQNTKLFLTTGLLGGLSTFSTFSLETIELFNAEKYLLSALNVALNLGLSLCGVIFGLIAAKATTQ